MAGPRPTARYGPRLRSTLASARLALLWERLWRFVWAPVAVLAVLAGLVLMEVPQLIGGWAWLAVLASGVLLSLWSIWRARRNLSWPRREEVRRRVEIASALPHRPLAGLEDRQATGMSDSGATGLWALHQARLAAAARGLQAGWPSPHVAEHDRWGLRGMALLVLVLGIVIAGGQWRDRLASGLAPNVAGAVAATLPVTLDLYITPPSYTGRPPIYVSTVDGRNVRRDDRGAAGTEPEGDTPGPETIAIPEGSTVAARVNGTEGEAPTLTINDGEQAFAAAGDSFEIEATVSSGRELGVSLGGRDLGHWPIDVRQDAPPTVEFADPPGATRQHAIRFAYAATDDYGVKQVRLRISLAPDAPQILARPDLDFEMPVPGRLPTEVQGERIESLIAHVWAGFPVLVEFEATDAADQTGVSETVVATLPEFPFQHPVAQSIIKQRRTLLLEPERVQNVIDSLDQLSQQPDRFYEDAVVFLALRMAARRLALSGGEVGPHVEPVQRLLWDTAMRLEGGNALMAMERLRDLQQRLREALSDPNATDEEIAELMEQLRQAMDEYMEQMQQAMQQAIEEGLFDDMEMNFDGETISRDELQEMIDRMQELSESGAREQAQELLSELQRMMEGMMPMPSQMGQNGQQRQTLQDLQELMDSQRRLMDETFQQMQGEGEGQDGEGSAGRQQELRDRLDELSQRIEEMTGEQTPESMGRAGQAMEDATGNLRGGRPEDAIGDQSRAIDELREGMAGLAEQLMDQMRPGRDNGQTAGNRDQLRRDRDPLGRPIRDSQSASTQDMDIPDQMDTQRAREILQELRQRVSDRNRPEPELDYLQRLLELF